MKSTALSGGVNGPSETLRSGLATFDASAFVARSCKYLDAGETEQWLSLCAPELSYQIVAFSEELGMHMHWLDHKRDELVALFKNIPSHVRTEGKFFRQSGIAINCEEDGLVFETPVAIYHTSLRGETAVYAVCRYRDRLTVRNESVLLSERIVSTDTKTFRFGSHMIL